MRIVLEKYTIGSDSSCWTLYDRKTKESGEEYEVPRAYFPSLPSLLQSIPDKDLRSADGTVTFADVLSLIEKIMGELREIGEKVEKDWPKNGGRLTQVSGTSREEEPNVYPLPGSILNLFPDLNVVRTIRKGRGTTAFIRIEEDEKGSFIEALREKQAEHPLIVNRALTILGV